MSQSLVPLKSRNDNPSLDTAWLHSKQGLVAGDLDSWNEVFDLLYPVAFQSARVILAGKFESECEDVAMESLTEIVRQVAGSGAHGAESLKPLAAAIARNKSKDLLRRRLSKKRGENNLESLDLMIESCGEGAVSLPQADFLDTLTIAELGELLIQLSRELKKEYRLILKDHFFDNLSYSEIADKRNIAVGSVGKYLQRGISCLRVIVERNPKLRSELRETLTDFRSVDVLLPLVSAVQLSPYNPKEYIRYSRPQLSDTDWTRPIKTLTDEEILLSAPDELPEPSLMKDHHRARMLNELKATFPETVNEWTLRRARRTNQGVPCSSNCPWFDPLIPWIKLLSLIALFGALIFGLSRMLDYLP